MNALYITTFSVNNPFELSKPLPYKDYKFVEEFDETKYGKDYGCIMLCDVKTTDKIRNDPLFKQNPMLVSKCLITDTHLSDYQLNCIKKEKVIIQITIQ